MKKIVLVLSMIVVLCVFTGCEGEEQATKEPIKTHKAEETIKPEDTSAPQPDEEADDELSLMQKALLNKEKVKLVDTKEMKYLNEILSVDAYGEEGKDDSKKYDFFYYEDMDGNGTKEVALSTTYIGGDFLIFFEIDDVIYAQEWPYRGMNPLYNDGVMEGSNGAADNVITKVKEITKDGVKDELIVNIISDDYLGEAKYYTKENREGEITYDEYVELMNSYSFNLAGSHGRSGKYIAKEYDYSERVIRHLLREGKEDFTYEVNRTGEEEDIKWDITIKREKDGFSQDIVLVKDSLVSCIPTEGEMVEVVDVNFDGYFDILILKGYYGAQGAKEYEAYIWNEQTKNFVRDESFNQIPNPDIDYDKELIIGDNRASSSTHDYSVYRYENGEFINVAVISATFTDDDKMNVSERRFADGKWSEKTYVGLSYEEYEEKYEQLLGQFA